MLLRLYDLQGGRILIDGQDIAGVTQESLRSQIGVVTQDTSLLHRSIRDNLLYGRPDASEQQLQDAVRRARAGDFIAGLIDGEAAAAWTRALANAASSCPAASASASRSPACCSRTPPS